MIDGSVAVTGIVVTDLFAASMVTDLPLAVGSIQSFAASMAADLQLTVG